MRRLRIFCVLILSAGVLFSSRYVVANGGAAPTTQSAIVSNFSCFGLKLRETPPGWHPIEVRTQNNVVRWLSPEGESWEGLLAIDLVQTRVPTLREFADRYAASNRGQLTDIGSRIGGSHTFRVAGMPVQPGVTRETLIAQHDDRFYVVSCCSAPGEEHAHQALGQLADAITFVPPTSPLATLTLRDESTKVLGVAQMRLIENMRPSADRIDLKGATSFVCIDYATPAVVLEMTAQIEQVDGDPPAEKFGKELVWDRLNGPFDGKISSTYEKLFADQKAIVQTAVIRLDAKRRLIFNFLRTSGSNVALHKEISDASRRMVESVELLPPK